MSPIDEDDNGLMEMREKLLAIQRQVELDQVLEQVRRTATNGHVLLVLSGVYRDKGWQMPGQGLRATDLVRKPLAAVREHFAAPKPDGFDRFAEQRTDVEKTSTTAAARAPRRLRSTAPTTAKIPSTVARPRVAKGWASIARPATG